MKSEEVIARLQQELPTDLKCPMCGNNRFSLVSGFFNNSVQTKMSEFQLGGKSVPTIAVVCDKCGFVSQHAIGVLCPDLLRGTTDNDKS